MQLVKNDSQHVGACYDSPRNGASGGGSSDMAKLTKEDVRKFLGGSLEELAAELSEFAQAAKVLSTDHPRLIDEHPNEWVGVFQGRVAASAGSLNSLLAKLAEEGVPVKRTIVRFIDRDEKTLLL